MPGIIKVSSDLEWVNSFPAFADTLSSALRHLVTVGASDTLVDQLNWAIGGLRYLDVERMPAHDVGRFVTALALGYEDTLQQGPVPGQEPEQFAAYTAHYRELIRMLSESARENRAIQS